jgi:hypothetical protein
VPAARGLLRRFAPRNDTRARAVSSQPESALVSDVQVCRTVGPPLTDFQIDKDSNRGKSVGTQVQHDRRLGGMTAGGEVGLLIEARGENRGRFWRRRAVRSCSVGAARAASMPALCAEIAEILRSQRSVRACGAAWVASKPLRPQAAQRREKLQEPDQGNLCDLMISAISAHKTLNPHANPDAGGPKRCGVDTVRSPRRDDARSL